MELNTLQKFLLLAQHPKKGAFATSHIYISYGIIGAILLELALLDKISIEKEILIVKNDRGVDHSMFSEVLTKIKSSKKPRKVKHWIIKLARESRAYKWTILNELVDQRIVRIESKKFLGFIPYKRHYLIDKRIRTKLIDQVKKNIFSKEDLIEKDVIVLGLVEACKMHRIITTDRGELKRLKKELKEIIKDSPIAETVDTTIKQVQATIMMAIIAASVTTTTTSN
ncbi:GOLPH3/VPS74 family protein [Ekhidna sp.]